MRLIRLAAAVLVVAVCAGRPANAEPQLPSLETARVTVPAFVQFQVTDVTTSTEALTGTTTLTYDTALLSIGHVLRISVKADGDLTPPGGSAIPASNISWQTSAVSNGIGINGVLSKTTYTQVFHGDAGVTSGSVDLVWTLSSPGSSIRAGTHEVTLRWKIESIMP